MWNAGGSRWKTGHCEAAARIRGFLVSLGVPVRVP